MNDNPTEYKLHNPPADGISNLKFAPNSDQFLLVSSWDSSVRLYDINSNTMRAKYSHSMAVLDCCFYDAVHSFSGGLDNGVRSYDFNTNTEQLLGTHSSAVRCIDYVPEVSILASGSWDQTIKLWDPKNNRNIETLAQPDKVYTMAVCGDKLIVGTAGRKVLIWDLRTMGLLQKRESSLRYQTRCIRAFPNKQGFVMGSIEGRVAVEYIDPSSDIQRKKYAFKCHRIKEGAQEQVYPVNAISFNRGYGTFATGGSDGFVSIWDGLNKKRLNQLKRYPTSIAALSFSNDGTLLAIASSFLYEQENDNPPEDAIFIRTMSDQETKPK